MRHRDQHYCAPEENRGGDVPAHAMPRYQRGRRSAGFRLFAAGDGTLVQLRLPGGLASIGLLRTLVCIAERGGGFVQLTSRGNLQLRGLAEPVPHGLIAEVLATELVPTPSHERIRNIVASPLSGVWPVNRTGGPAAAADVRPLVLELDHLIRTDPLLCGLSARFLFAVDDGRGDLLARAFDAAYRAVDTVSGEIRLGTAGHPGFRVAATEAPAALVGIARSFRRLSAATTPPPLHLRDLAEQPAGIRREELGPLLPGPPVLPGAIGPHAVAGLPRGRITRAALAGLCRMTDRVVLTSERSLVVPGAAHRLSELAEAGLVIDPVTDRGHRVDRCRSLPLTSGRTGRSPI